MTAIILAAGTGSRMGLLTASQPKCMLDVGGRTLLDRALDGVKAAGIARVVIVTGAHADHIRSAATGYPGLDVQCIHNESFAATANNYSLWLAARELRGESWLVMDSDILFDPCLPAVLVNADHDDALLVRDTGAIGSEEIKVTLDAGRVLAIGKTISPSAAAGESIGMEKFSATTTVRLAAILERRRLHNEFYEASFQELIDTGTTIAPVSTGALACIEIDTPEDLLEARELARKHHL